jgi:hypothetical protein
MNITLNLTPKATHTTLPALAKASCGNKLGFYLPLNLLIFKSLIIKLGLNLLGSPVWPTLKKSFYFKVKRLKWKKV